MASQVVDISAIIQIIGNIFINPSLLDREDLFFHEEDFTEEFHKVIFGSIYNLHSLGAEEITVNTIIDYLSSRPKALAIFNAHKGSEYLQKIAAIAQPDAFSYYYHRVKKMSLLRAYYNAGLNLSDIYDVNNTFDMKKKQQQEEWLDNTPIEDIADYIDKRILDIRLKYVNNADTEFAQGGDGIFDLIEKLRTTPSIGYPMFGPLINTVTRGARLKKVYMRSAATGIGKTRTMIADACNFACNEIYDIYNQCWIKNGTKEPTVFISTEQEKEELQTMMLAFVSGVNEEHILTGKYDFGEADRVIKAAKILVDSPLYIKELPDFSMQDIENTIKFSIKEYGVKYVCHDYIHSSMKILSEISSKAGVKGLREDNILFMIGVRLKDLANQYGVFILTATQLNGGYVSAEVFDQNLLRGAKSLGDKIDVGMIMLGVDGEDLEKIRPIINNNGLPQPQVKISIYKNRQGRWKDILLWCKADRGTCRIEPMFATDYNYSLLDIQDLKIEVNDEA